MSGICACAISTRLWINGIVHKVWTFMSGRPILYIEGFHKNISFLSLEIESVLKYSVDPEEKSFVQYFLWVFTVCHSPRLLQIDLNKILTICESKTTLSFDTWSVSPLWYGQFKNCFDYHSHLWSVYVYTSRENLCLLPPNSKGAGQNTHLRSLIIAFIFRYLLTCETARPKNAAFSQGTVFTVRAQYE